MKILDWLERLIDDEGPLASVFGAVGAVFGVAYFVWRGGLHNHGIGENIAIGVGMAFAGALGGWAVFGVARPLVIAPIVLLLMLIVEFWPIVAVVGSISLVLWVLWDVGK